MNKRQLGMDKEECAAKYLIQQGYRILERNYRTRFGEIDIIAKEGEYLCFVEVKFRSNHTYGTGLDAVDYHKQAKIRQVANYYLMKNGYGEWTSCRFDIVAMEGEKILLLRNAFEG